MEISGKIEEVFELVKGGAVDKPWFKQDYLLDIFGTQYPKKVLFSLWGVKIDEYMLKENDEITAQINIESKKVWRQVVYKRCRVQHHKAQFSETNFWQKS